MFQVYEVLAALERVPNRSFARFLNYSGGLVLLSSFSGSPHVILEWTTTPGCATYNTIGGGGRGGVDPVAP